MCLLVKGLPLCSGFMNSAGVGGGRRNGETGLQYLVSKPPLTVAALLVAMLVWGWQMERRHCQLTGSRTAEVVCQGGGGQCVAGSVCNWVIDY